VKREVPHRVFFTCSKPSHRGCRAVVFQSVPAVLAPWPPTLAMLPGVYQDSLKAWVSLLWKVGSGFFAGESVSSSPGDAGNPPLFCTLGMAKERLLEQLNQSLSLRFFSSVYFLFVLKIAVKKQQVKIRLGRCFHPLPLPCLCSGLKRFLRDKVLLTSLFSLPTS